MKQQIFNELRETFGSNFHENVPMAKYTTANVGGPVNALIAIHSEDELANCVQTLWRLSLPFMILGSGSNILVSDKGIDTIVVQNRATNIKIETNSDPAYIFAESGASLGVVARQSAQKGLSGMEWAAPIPGTIGGAIYGNAGAYGTDIKAVLKMAKILHKNEGIADWPLERFEFKYRSSIFKREKIPAVILSATFNTTRTSPEEAMGKINSYLAHRKETQPPGASMGSMFKNPPGESAAKLIEAAGLKGHRVGRAIISPIHSNFIINLDEATAQDVYQLMRLVQKTVEEKFAVRLTPEIELLGDFE